MKKSNIVSIPQAVGTVATCKTPKLVKLRPQGFNTASGRHCCNLLQLTFSYYFSFPRFNTASGRHCCNLHNVNSIEGKVSGFNTASGRHCCNTFKKVYSKYLEYVSSFNTASGRHCCNHPKKCVRLRYVQFQYRKRQALLQLYKEL